MLIGNNNRHGFWCWGWMFCSWTVLWDSVFSIWKWRGCDRLAKSAPFLWLAKVWKIQQTFKIKPKMCPSSDPTPNLDLFLDSLRERKFPLIPKHSCMWLKARTLPVLNHSICLILLPKDFEFFYLPCSIPNTNSKD